MAVEVWGEVVRRNPATKNKAGTEVWYQIRFYKKDTPTSPIRRIPRNKVGFFGDPNVGKYTWELHVIDVNGISEGALLVKEEEISWQDPGGPIVKENMDYAEISFKAASPNYYTPAFYFYITGTDGSTVIGYGQSAKPGVIPQSVLDTFGDITPMYFKVPQETPFSIIDASKLPYKYQTEIIPKMGITKKPVTPDMPSDLKGRNNDGGQSGLDNRCLGFQYDSCRKRWITIWKTRRYVNPKTHKIATTSEASAIDSGQGPKGYNKQFTYYIESVTDKAYKDNPGKTLEQLRAMKLTVRPYTAPGWDWASNNLPYNPPGTGTSLGSFKLATETQYRKFINGNCEELPPAPTGPANPDKSTVLPTIGNNSNPPPHIVTRHFSPVADYTKEN